MTEQPDAGESAPRIAWETAEVGDGDLHVELAGELPKRWGRRFGEVLERLTRDGDRGWGQVKVAKGTIVVRDVGEGSESELRHELESALRQTNADLGAIDTDAGSAQHDEGPEQQRDGRMTAAFRGFADAS